MPRYGKNSGNGGSGRKGSGNSYSPSPSSPYAGDSSPSSLTETVFDLVAAEMERVKARSSGDAWYVPDSDEEGESCPVAARISPAMMRALQYLMASDKFPYLTQSDLIRSALHIHLVFMFAALKGEEKVPQTPLTAYKLIAAAVREAKTSHSMEKAVGTLEEKIRELVATGNKPAAIERTAALLSMLQGLDESDWRDKAIARVKRVYDTAIR